MNEKEFANATTTNVEQELSAERSIEIIRRSIEENRRNVSAHTGIDLLWSGIATAGMAMLIGIINLFTFSANGHFLWFLLPFIIWGIMKYVNKNKDAQPSNVISTLVGKTWWTFAFFTLGFFLFSIIFNIFLAKVEGIDVFDRLHINPTKTIILLMGMAITIMGHILKQKWLVACGIIGGLGGFIWETIGITSIIGARLLPLESFSKLSLIAPCITFFLFSLVGLVLPGWQIMKASSKDA